MFCEKCGKPIEEGSAFCAECGAAVETAPVETAPEVEEVAPVVVAEPVVEEAPAFAEPDFVEPPKKKKGLFLKILIPVVSCILVAVIGIFTPVYGTILKWFSADKYFDYVNANAIDDFNDDFAHTMYKNFLANYGKDVTSDASVELTVDKSLADLVGLPEEIVSTINKSKLTFDIASNGNKLNLGALVNLGGKDLVSVDAIMDMGAGAVYLAIPEICEDYLSVNLEDVFAFDMDSFKEGTKLSDDIIKALPSEKVLAELISKYTDIVFECIDDVEKETEKVEIEGVKQNCTVLTFKINERTALKMVKAVLKEAKSDVAIKDILKDVESALRDAELYEGPSFVDSYKGAIDDLLDELSEVEPSSTQSIKIAEFVNNKHEIVGFEVKVGGQEIVSFLSIERGKKFATEIIAADGEFEIIGSGTVKKNVKAGTFEVNAQDQKIAKIEVSNLNTKDFANGIYSANLKISVDESLLDEIDLPEEISSALSLVDCTIEIDVNVTENTSELALNILKGKNTVLFGIKLGGNFKDSANVSVPKDAINATDSEALQEYLAAIDLTSIMEILEEKLGITEEDLMDAVGSLMSGGFGSNSVEPEYNYYDDTVSYYDYY